VGAILIATWGILGALGLLGSAIWRLAPLAVEPWSEGQLAVWQMAVCGIWVVFNAYAEGYKGFQKGYSPRVVGRAFHLSTHPRWYLVLLAPIYAMGLICATRKRLIIGWCLVVLILIVVFLVKLIPQPWRGIIDAGVVVGLAWGILTTLYYYCLALTGRLPEEDLALS